MSLHQLVIHRRDTVINAKMRAKSNPVIISDEHLSKLRYGPIIGAEELFDPEIVRSVIKERDEEKANRLQTAALTKLAFQSPNRVPKRSMPSTSTGASTERPPKKKRSMPSTQTQGAAASATVVNNQLPTPRESPSGAAMPHQNIR